MSFTSQITDPEELESLELQKLWWQWYNAIIFGLTDDLEEWLRVNRLQVLNDYKYYESKAKPGVYYLGLSSWCWNNHRDICKTFMTEQGIE